MTRMEQDNEEKPVQTSKEEVALIYPVIGSYWDSSENCECGMGFIIKADIGGKNRI